MLRRLRRRLLAGSGSGAARSGARVL